MKSDDPMIKRSTKSSSKSWSSGKNTEIININSHITYDNTENEERK